MPAGIGKGTIADGEDELCDLRSAVKGLVCIDRHFKNGTCLGYRGESPKRQCSRSRSRPQEEEEDSRSENVVVHRVNQSIRAAVRRRAVYQQEEEKRRELLASLGCSVDAMIRQTVTSAVQ